MPAPVETPYLRPGVLTAVLSGVLSLLVAGLMVTIARGGGGLGVAPLLRTATRTWLVPMGSGLEAGSVSLGLVPVGAMLVCVGLVALVAGWVVTDPVDDVLAYAATTAGTYGVVAGIASALTNVGDVHTSVVRAAFGAFVVGGLGAALGVMRRHGVDERWWFTSSLDVRRVVRAAVPGVLAVLAVAGVLVVVLLITHLRRAGDLWALLDPGAGGGVALVVGSVLAVPTLVLWTASALIGPGFALGTDTSVDLTGSQLGQVPGFPLLAALPGPGAFPGWVFVLGLVPLLAGGLAGWRVDPGPTGEDDDRNPLLRRIVLGAGAGGVAGFVLGVLVGLSGGAVGPGRMADAGPPALTPLLVAVPVMAMGGALGAVLKHYRGDRASRSSDTRETGRPRLWQRLQPSSPDRRVDDA